LRIDASKRTLILRSTTSSSIYLYPSKRKCYEESWLLIQI